MTNPSSAVGGSRALRRLIGAACVTAAGVAGLTLAGWSFDVPRLTTFSTGAPAMNPLTAVCILLACASLFLQQHPASEVRATRIARACAALVVAFAALRLAGPLAAFPIPVDLVLFRDELLASSIPNRMAFNTALGLVCIGLTLFVLDRPVPHVRRWSEPLLFVVLTLSLAALVGHIYGARPMRGFMAVNTASALVLLASAALFTRPDHGICRLLLSDSPGGAMARRVVPAAVVMPLVLGWLRLAGQRAGLYGLEFGTGLLVLALAATLVALACHTGHTLNRADRARHEAELELRTSVERHNRLLEANLIGVLTARLPGRITDANPAFLEMLGYSREELPLEADAITPPEWREPTATARRELAEHGVATPYEKEYLHKDGHRVRVLIGAAALSGTDGEVMAFVVDISARRQAELEIQRMRAFLDSIIENLPLMVFVKDARELRFVQFNRAGEELLGFSREQLIGRNDHDFFPAAEADFFTAKDRAVLETRQLVDIPEEPIQTRHGERRILHTRKVPILDRDGTPRYMLGISEDITARKRAEQQLALLHAGLQRRTAELESANQELESFSYSVSHDLRAPLRHIDGFADLLTRHAGPALDPKARHYLETISSSARSMGLLIDDLLAFSRMNRAELQEELVDLEPLVAQVRRELGEPAAAAEWHVEPLPVVQGDRAMLRLVFTNLFGNALKYAGRGQRPVIHVGTQPAADETVVYVRDNGVGFDMKYAHKLFGVFQRLHSDDEFEGTGIGLANVRRVIGRHGGRVWAEGAVDGGATFYVALPRPTMMTKIEEAA